MIRKNRIIIAIASAACMMSCGKETMKPYAPVQERTVVEIALPMAKSSLRPSDGVYMLVWNKGDIVTVNGVSSEPLASEFDGERRASFVFPALSGKGPWNMITCAAEGVPDAVKFNVSQPYRPDGMESGQWPMWASDADSYESLMPSTLGSVFAVSFSGEGVVLNSVVVEAAGGEYLSGVFVLGKNGKGLYDGTADAVSGCRFAGVVSQEGVALKPDGTVFYIVVPAGHYEAGFKAYATASDGSSMELKFFTSGADLCPDTVYELAGLEPQAFTAGSSANIIATPQQLDKFLSKANDATANGIIVTDIDLRDYGWKSKNNFYGTLDGLGNTVSGLDVSLFGNLYGKVRNITVEGDVKYSGINDGTEHDGGVNGVGIIAHYHYCYKEGNSAKGLSGASLENVAVRGTLEYTGETTVNHAMYIGGLVGACNGVLMTDCRNYASVTVSGDIGDANKLCVGGLAGVTQSKPDTLAGCVNYGEITVMESVSSGIYAGGIAGLNTQANVFDSCENHGTVSLMSSSKNMAGAGILGHSDSGIKVIACINAGEVRHTGVASVQVHIGGIAGHGKFASKAAEFTGCINRGTIKNESSTVTKIRMGGIVGITETNNISIYGCANTGDILNIPAVKPSRIDAGGVAGYIGGGTANIIRETTSKCTVSGYGDASLKPSTYIVAGFAANCYKATSIEKCGLAGNVDGTEITSANIDDWWFKGKTGNPVVVDCYLIEN